MEEDLTEELIETKQELILKKKLIGIIYSLAFMGMIVLAYYSTSVRSWVLWLYLVLTAFLVITSIIKFKEFVLETNWQKFGFLIRLTTLILVCIALLKPEHGSNTILVLLLMQVLSFGSVVYHNFLKSKTDNQESDYSK